VSPMLMLTLRFLKLCFAALFAAGVLGTIVSDDLPTRKRSAHVLAGMGFGGSWILGFVLTPSTGASYLSAFVLGGMVTSMTALHIALYRAGKEGRGGRTSAVVGVLALIATYALMGYRPL
jgi:MFS family permease